jgi:hypothetical protein
MASTLPDTTKSLGLHTAVEDGSGGGKKPIRWPGFVHFFFLLSVVMCALVYAPRFLAPSLTSVAGVDFFKPRPSPLGRVAEEQVRGVGGGGASGVEDALVLDNQVNSPCASMPSHGICCDRSDFNTDVCFMSGDVRTDAASLSFLGLGSQPPSPEWGRMLSEGRGYLRDQWWISTGPGLAIMLTVLAINIMGDWLRDFLDPRLRGRS